MRIKITIAQFSSMIAEIGDVQFFIIEEGNGGNLSIFLDGTNEEIILAENGEVL